MWRRPDRPRCAAPSCRLPASGALMSAPSASIGSCPLLLVITVGGLGGGGVGLVGVGFSGFLAGCRAGRTGCPGSARLMDRPGLDLHGPVRCCQRPDAVRDGDDGAALGQLFNGLDDGRFAGQVHLTGGLITGRSARKARARDRRWA